MKTPREVIFERRWAARPKLDAIRQGIIGEINNKDTKAQSRKINLASWCLGGVSKLWVELIVPSRLVWAGLAAVWLLLFVVNFSMQDHSRPSMAKASSPAEMAATVHQEQELLAQLLGPDEPVVAEPQKKYVPRPSSWCAFETMAT
jgi:hypothetical protein